MGQEPSASHSTFVIVTPVYNSMEFLPKALPSLEAAARMVGGHVVAVDNGSTDGSYEYLMRHSGDRTSVHLLPHATIGAVRNFGARQSSAGVIAFLDSDCTIDFDYLLEAAKVLNDTDAAATGSKHELPDKPGWIERTWHELHCRRRDGWSNYIPSGNFVVVREAFDDVGGFDEHLPTGEDAELCLRLNAAGHRVYASSRVSARHHGNPKTLRGFARRERWHGLGMLGTLRGDPADKVFWLTGLHVVAVLAACAMITIRGWDAAVPALLLAEAPPATAVAYRWIQIRRIVRPVRSLLLYTIYLWARGAALLSLAANRLTERSNRGR